jgi:heterodisulfide reductase subunit B
MAASGDAAAKALDIELVELPKWNCCGATFPLATDNLLALIAPTRTLVNARKEGDRLVTLCAICYNVLQRTNNALQAAPDKRKRINDFIEADYTGDLRVEHLLGVLRNEIGFESLSQRVTKKLAGLKVAPYYGCLLLRPYSEIGLDDPEAPTILDDLLRSLGADVIDFPHKTECCGAYLSVNSPQVTDELSRAVLNSAVRHGAEVLATACPLCQYNLNSRQAGSATVMPVLYFTQVLALALGLEGEALVLEDQLVDARPLLASKGLVEAHP